jgi:hypothetical protein
LGRRGRGGLKVLAEKLKSDYKPESVSEPMS